MEKPHGFVIHISPFIGELLRTGEILPRLPNLEEISLLDLKPVIISKNFPSYKQALIGLSEELKRIRNEKNEKNENDI